MSTRAVVRAKNDKTEILCSGRRVTDSLALGLIKKAQIESTTIYVAFIAFYCKAEKTCMHLLGSENFSMSAPVSTFLLLLFWGFSFIKQNSSRIHESNMTVATISNKTSFNVANNLNCLT